MVEEHTTLDLGIGDGGSEGEHEVELVVLELCDELCHCRLRDVHLHVGVLAEEGCDGLGHDAGEGESDADVELATHEVFQFVESQQAVIC